MKKYSDSIKQRLTARHEYTYQFIDNEDIKGKKILDIGSSFGWFENWAVKDECKKIIALEPKKNNFRNARKEVPKAVFKIGSGLEIPEKENYFNTVVCFEVLEHLPKNSEQKFFHEVSRVIKNGGLFYLSVPNKNFFSNIGDPAWWLIGHRHYTFKELKDIALEAGFKINKISYKGKYWEQISLIILYISKHLFGKEMLLKNWLEEKRRKEYFGPPGWVNLFLKLTKNE